MSGGGWAASLSVLSPAAADPQTYAMIEGSTMTVEAGRLGMTTVTDTDAAPRLDSAALVLLPLRLVLGWTYFSAFWRRAVLANKLDPDLPGYVGEKFNHFLPHAIGIGPVIEHLLTHQGLLRVVMTVFTLTEAVVGVCILMGLCTRAAAAGVTMLALGILLGAGWLGTTCVDEWQIGILGVAGGLALAAAGGGRYSLDHVLAQRFSRLGGSAAFRRLASGPVRLRPPVIAGVAAAVLALTLATNQHFHGGVYGPLHNKSVAPLIEVSDAGIADGALSFRVYRTEGVDVYGSFLVGVSIIDDATAAPVFTANGDRLAALGPDDITNRYVAKVKPGHDSLVVPLGAKARITLPTGTVRFNPNRHYTVVLTDISGATWRAPVRVAG